jgi:hypothetical protein
VRGAHEYDKAKEKAGFVAGKHIQKQTKWWFQNSKKEWKGGDGESVSGGDGVANDHDNIDGR